MSFIFESANQVLSLRFPVIVTTVLACTIVYRIFRRGPFDHIPSIGSTNFILSYIDAVRYIVRGPQVLQEGYDKFRNKGGVFRIPTITSWLVIVCSKELVEEMRSLKGEEELSAELAGRELMSGDHILGRPIYDNPYHLPILRSRLTKSLDSWFEPIRNEIMLVFEEQVPLTSEWESVKLYHLCNQIIARGSNRVFVSDPTICMVDFLTCQEPMDTKCCPLADRDPDYIRLITDFTLDVALGAFILALFPAFLKPLARVYLTNIPRAMKSITEYLSENIKARQKSTDEYGRDYPDKENDMLSFFMDDAEGEEREEGRLTLRLLMVNFASIHTSSMTLSGILQDLADRPEYVGPLREEIESVISEHGWSKASLSYMHKLDSFIMESQRVKTSRAITAMRWSVKDYTFSNGVKIPKNAMIAVAMRPRHYDSEFFENPNKFDGWRFCKSDDASRNLHLTSNKSPFLLFGVGEHACPGRFFAANTIKTAVAHFLMTHDVKPDLTNPPRDTWIGPDLLPNNATTLLFKERKG
ncbi:hypothetical protein Clacol_009944 [Clathrus columnatus]|uniref:Cytochrome P450 n=1 Tax=Clathrus columnatus TaxID=1419009 RepID=A0AAV5ATK0_9AGAM|nr:hypothetical protein Clacol_009944 [Clathrus columnatus]